MQDRRVEIVDVDRVFGDVVAEVVGLAVSDPAFDPATCHPHAEVSWMMVATVVVSRESTLAVDGASELTAPDDQRILEHSESFQVFD